MNAAPVFDRVYARLKQMLRQNAFGPASHLDPGALGELLVASVTPVRDALHRLAGERLVDFTNEGFQAPLMSEPDLRDLYAWNHQLLLLALRTTLRSQAAFLPPPPEGAHPAEAAEALFGAIARAGGNREQAFAIEALNDRLHAARRAETLVLAGLHDEVAGLYDADLRTLRRALGQYHRRRAAAVPAIVRALYRA